MRLKTTWEIKHFLSAFFVSLICKRPVWLFFIVLFSTGFCIYTDYGLSWDEPTQRVDNGKLNYYYIATLDSPTLLRNSEKYHGPAFEIFLATVERVLNINDTHSIFFMRHLLTFLTFFVSLVFFYLLCYESIGSKWIALLGCVFMVLSPRIFAESFYNSKDIAFLSFFIIGIYTLFRFDRSRSYISAFLHAVVSGFLIDIRIVGILLPFITLMLLFTGFFTNRKSIPVIPVLIYLFVLVFTIILCWPVLWEAPVYHFTEAFKEMSRFPWPLDILFRGRYLKGTEVPWYYIPVWIGITTPVLYTVLFFIGFAFIIRKPQYLLANKAGLISLMWLLIPLFMVIVFHSVLYDGWRHLYFVYPAIIYIALVGFNGLLSILKNKINPKYLIYVLVIVSCVHLAYIMLIYHPYQNVYFNFLAGKNLNEIKNKFELDYWGLSYREGLEYILAKDTSRLVTINASNIAGEYSLQILTNDQRKRIRYTKKKEEADYFLTNYRWLEEGEIIDKEYYLIQRDGASIMGVYTLNK